MKLASMMASVLAVAGSAMGQIDGGDVALSADAWGRLRTMASDEDGNLYPGVRVHTGRFDVAPNFTNEPGFDSEFGAFTPGTPLGFAIRAALRVWDDGLENFDAIPAEKIRMQLGPLGPVVTPETDEVVDGFYIAAGGDGKFHHHFGFTLLEPSGDGVYLLELEVRAQDGSLASSRPVFVVFGQNADDEELARAAAWTAGHYACPSDVNDDHAVDLLDFFDFFDAFDLGLGAADIDCNNEVDLTDFFAFFNGFDAGC